MGDASHHPFLPSWSLPLQGCRALDIYAYSKIFKKFVVVDFAGMVGGGDRFVLKLISKHNIQPHCLGITKAGYPLHPLYPRHPPYVVFSNHLSVHGSLLSW